MMKRTDYGILIGTWTDDAMHKIKSAHCAGILGNDILQRHFVLVPERRNDLWPEAKGDLTSTEKLNKLCVAG